MHGTSFETVILGSGPAGLTAAVYTSRSFLSTLVIAGDPPGGQLTTTTDVENFPGFANGIMGPKLIEEMRKQAKRFGTNFENKNVAKISGAYESGFSISTEDGLEFQARTLIITTGASAKWLGLESEQKLRGKGVSACATCDAFFFKDKTVAVVGGGDSAMTEAIFLTRFANKVYILVRKCQEDIKASKIMQDRAFANEKIEFMCSTQVKEVKGQFQVEGLTVINNQTDEESSLEVQGLFLAIGHEPNTKFLTGFLELDKLGYIKTSHNVITGVKGVFAAGDVADHRYRQAITAAGYGCMAAMEAEKLLAESGVATKSQTTW